MQTELKTLKSMMNNAQEQISDLEDRITETINQDSRQRTQMKKQKAIEEIYGII